MKITTLFSLATDPQALQAISTWTKFSLTSYRMVGSLARQDVIPNNIIDVGANVGQFSVACHHLLKSPNIYAFEPLPECFSKLEKNIRKFSNVRTYNFALGEFCGKTEFHVSSHSHSSSILKMEPLHSEAFPQSKQKEIINIQVKTLDTIFENTNLVGSTLLKIDVQGYEANVVKGGKEVLKRVDFILLEVSLKPLYAGELLFNEMCAFLESYGFYFSRPMGWLNDPRNDEVLQMDALFINSTSPFSSQLIRNELYMAS